LSDCQRENRPNPLSLPASGREVCRTIISSNTNVAALPWRSAAHIAIVTIILLIARIANAAGQAPRGANLSSQDRDAATLSHLAAQHFGALSLAEQRLIDAAPHREFRWIGPSNDDQSPLNDAAQGAKWGPERSIRHELLRWLIADPDASRLVHPSGLGFGGVKIDGPLDISYAVSTKPITIVHSYFTDPIDLSNAHLAEFDLRSSKVDSITADGSTIDGDVSLTFDSFSTISFFRSRIGGSIDCAGSMFDASGQLTVSVVEAQIGGDAEFHNGFTTNGTIDARIAKIGGALDFHAANFTGDDATGLDADRATIKGTFYWNEVKHTPKTTLDLENASAGAIWDDAASWPAPGNLLINGFVYHSIDGGPDNAESRLQWIALQPPGYHPQPYRQLAQIFRDAGRDQNATDMMIAKEVAQRRNTNMNRGNRLWSIMLQYTIGYGFRPLRALWWIGGFVLFGAILFGWGYHLRLITPTEEAAYAEFVKTGEAPPHYPVFNPFVYSLENFLPVVVLYQDSYWRPNPRHAVGGTLQGSRTMFGINELPSRILRAYLWIHILAGWLITPLLFAGLSGLVRPD